LSPDTQQRLTGLALQKAVDAAIDIRGPQPNRPRVSTPRVSTVAPKEDTFDPNQWLNNNVLSPAANVPGNKPFVGPTLDPEIIQARAQLRQTSAAARQAGIDPNLVETIATGEPDPNRGFIGIGKGILGAGKKLGGALVPDILDVSDIPLPGTEKNLGEAVVAVAKPVAKGVLQRAAGPLGTLDIGRRFITSTFKEIGDEVAVWRGTRERGVEKPGATGFEKFKGKGGFSVGDWYNQTFAGAFGLGDKFKADDPEVIAEAQQYGVSPETWAGIKNAEQGIGGGEFFANVKNPFLNQFLGFTTDVLFDPLTYGTGVGGLAKTVGARGALVSGARGARLANRFVDIEQAAFKAALKKKVALEAAEAAEAVGDTVTAAAQRELVKAAEKEAAKAAARAAADAPVRQLGEKSKRALATSILTLRNDAANFVERAKLAGVGDMTVTEVAQALTPGSPSTLGDDLLRAGFEPEEVANFAGIYADALRMTEAITDDVIANVQRSGLAGIAGTYADIIKGVRTPAQEALGARGGFRFYNPLELVGVGGKTFITPGTERITNVIGKIAADARLGVAKSPVGLRLLNVLGQVGEGGLLGSEDLLMMQNALKTGTVMSKKVTRALTNEESVLFTRLLDLNERFRGFVNAERRQAAGTLRQSGINNLAKEDLDFVLPYLQTDPTDWAKLGFPALTSAQQEAYDLVRDLMEQFYAYTAKVSGATGFVPPKITNYFPQLQTDKALRWMQRNPNAVDRLAKNLQVDRTWFLGNFRERGLKEGDIWFGHKLEAKDINVKTLNEFARKPADGSKGLDFDFFETDVLKALTKYVDKHAQFAAFQRALGMAPEVAPEAFIRGTTVEVPTFDASGNPIINYEFVNPQTIAPTLPPAEVDRLVKELGLGRAAIPGVASGVTGKLQIEALAAATPDQVKTLLTQVRDLTESLRAPAVIKDSFEFQVQAIENTIDDMNRILASMTPDEVDNALKVFTESASLEANQVLSELSRAPFDLPKAGAKWSEYVDYVNKGVEGLNPRTLPDLGAQAQVAEMLQNAQRMGTVEFSGRARQMATFVTNWLKANYTASPGFHLRNGLGNTFQFVVAGGDPINGINGGILFREIQNRVKNGATVRDAVLGIVQNPGKFKSKLDTVPGLKGLTRKTPEGVQEFNAVVNSLVDAYNYAGNVGYGQTGEVAEALGSRPQGFFLKNDLTRVERLPGIKQAGNAYAGVLTAGRNLGTGIENFSRFGLFWDGLVKGLTPQEAAARVDRYLLNYQEFSKLDKVARLVFPFWTFMSRNAPLAFQFAYTNPKAYAWYNSFRRTVEAQPEIMGGPVVPEYEKERGVFALERPFTQNIPDVLPFLPDEFNVGAIRPGLPFAGGGEDTLNKLISDPASLLANVNPLFRAPIEAASAFIERPYAPELGQYGGRGYTFFTGRPVVGRREEVQGKSVETVAKYLTTELFAPASPLKRIIAALPADMRPQLLADMLGVYTDEAQPELQQMQSLYGWLGLPLGNIRTSQQRRELERRINDLARRIDKKQSADYYERQEKTKKGQTTPTTGVFDPNEWLNVP
jgi:hypothetical protein